MPITWPWGDQLIMDRWGVIQPRLANWKRWMYRADFNFLWPHACAICQPIALGRMDTEGGCYANRPSA